MLKMSNLKEKGRTVLRLDSACERSDWARGELKIVLLR